MPESPRHTKKHSATALLLAPWMKSSIRSNASLKESGNACLRGSNVRKKTTSTGNLSCIVSLMLLHMRILLAAVTPSHPQHSYMELLVANTRLDLQNRRRHSLLRCCLTHARRHAMRQVHRNPQKSTQDQRAIFNLKDHLKKSIYIAMVQSKFSTRKAHLPVKL